MAVNFRSPMTRHMFDYGQNAAVKQTPTDEAAKSGDDIHISTECTITDYTVGVWGWNIKHRQAVHSNTQVMEIRGDKANVIVQRTFGSLGVAIVPLSEHAHRRITRPMGRR